MPIFEYRCDGCGKQFEELVSSGTKVTCPSCHASRVTKKFSVPAKPAMAKGTAPTCDPGVPAAGCCGGACHQH